MGFFRLAQLCQHATGTLAGTKRCWINKWLKENMHLIRLSIWATSTLNSCT